MFFLQKGECVCVRALPYWPFLQVFINDVRILIIIWWFMVPISLGDGCVLVGISSPLLEGWCWNENGKPSDRGKLDFYKAPSGKVCTPLTRSMWSYHSSPWTHSCKIVPTCAFIFIYALQPVSSSSEAHHYYTNHNSARFQKLNNARKKSPHNLVLGFIQHNHINRSSS